MKTWGRFVLSMELRKILAYRSDFWITFLGQTFIQLFVARALWQSVFEANGTNSMNGYDIAGITLYYLISPIGNKILTGENIGFMSREIYEGSFTRYLIYPISFFGYKSITYLTHSLFYSVQLIIIFLLYSAIFGAGLPDASGFGFLLLGVLSFFMAAIVFLGFSFSIELLALWADNIWSLMVSMRFFTMFLGGGLIPITFFPLWAQGMIVWTPFPYLISFPIRTMMGQVSLQEWMNKILVLMVWAVVFNIVPRLIWKKGQYQYSGVGI